MREDICTIPVNEIFEVKCGCPICRMYDEIETKMLEYITGSAMMEPDVRVETNKVGFCEKHFNRMFKDYGRLQLGLMLDTHLNEFDLSNPSALYKAVSGNEKTCFVCDKIEWGFSRLISQIYLMYETEPEFRDMFNSQPEFCLKHYKLLMDNANKKTMKKQHKVFAENLFKITADNLKEMQKNLKLFAKMYDYNSDKNSPEFSNCRDAVERSVKFISGQKEIR